MPLFLMSAICLVIMLLTGVMKGACSIARLSAPKLSLTIAAAIGLHYLTLAIGREFIVDFGALALMLLPPVLAKNERPTAGWITAVLLFSLLCALVEGANSFAGASNGLLTGVLSGFCAMLCSHSPRCAMLAAASTPVLTRIVVAFVQTVSEGYSCLYIAGEALLTAQLTAIFLALVFIHLEREQSLLTN